ncbi:TonB family protein [Ferrimonas balearica DSM 9799]|uniref:Protein TonB n=1 Tax=Ferrimonas balearica (strain DSM 9799 / CCM 4581 / KCTC 23876 / PAT) TaxID=550540 RepID=E1SNE4_FERBD|nr:energy transducer TonB [Ferrimonas balearica]ADN75628.1 TonB family protein [Ferrimonas balearica DSM 9799]MBW3138526.1 energy transducer TonB [Ferrimonas balearica]MBW3163881.1 energy transducer TonB [Ferrimonas balearica]MBY5979296.1 energy transducer TonB [Ferrimonas balearica]MBY6223876.1 energy transducer TonB [Ferrimonas balearica]
MRDYLLALCLGGAITAGLFSLMAMMVTGGPGKAPSEPGPAPVSVLMADRPEQLNRRSRALPEPPPPLPELPQAQVVENSSATNVQMNLDLPTLSIDGPGDIQIGMPAKADLATADRQAMPLYRVEPAYPQRALRMRAEGYVLMEFTIDEQGRPRNIRVIESEPVRLFDQAAMKALARWKYQPKQLDGKAVSQPGQTAKLEFKLNR